MNIFGHNEVCPCGSGKKHRDCCGRSSENVTFLAEKLLHTEVKRLWPKLQTFVSAYMKDVEEAFKDSACIAYLDWERLVVEEDLLGPFIEWFLFDYKPVGGSNLLEVFLEEEKESMREPFLREVEQWSETYFSVYEVREIITGKGAVFEDIFSSRGKRVHKPELIGDITEGDIILCRLLPLGSWYVLYGNIFIYPADAKDFFTLKIGGFRGFIEDHGRKYPNWAAFFKAHRDIFLEILCDLIVGPDDDDEVEDDITYGILRDFLCQPQPELGHNSPLQVCRSKKKRNRLEKFLANVEKGHYDEANVYLLSFGAHIDQIRSVLGLSSPPLAIRDFSWSNEKYKQEAELMVRRMESDFFPSEVEQALQWWHYCCVIESPIIRKTGSWAAGVEYYAAFKLAADLSQKEVAEKYSVSVGTVSRNAHKVEAIIESMQAEREEQAETPNIPERYLYRLHALLARQDFHSEEEMEKFIKGLNTERLLNLEPQTLSPYQKAQELVYDAWEAAKASEKIRLAREALAIDSRCADAYVILAEYKAEDADSMQTYYQKGVIAGEEYLGREFFTKQKGRFWTRVESRPYMRARMGLAQTLWETGNEERAIEHLTALLELNPDDYQGAKYLLSTCLLYTGRYQELECFFERYRLDNGAELLFNKALYLFIRKDEKADAILTQAITENSLIPGYLLDKKDLLVSCEVKGGTQRQAYGYAAYNKELWQKTTGALLWLHKICLALS